MESNENISKNPHLFNTNEELEEDILDDLFDTEDLEENDNPESKLKDNHAEIDFGDFFGEISNPLPANSFLFPNYSRPNELKKIDDDEVLSAYEDFIAEDNEEDNNLLEDSYIDVNEENVLFFNPWIYDAILNKTIQEMENDLKFDLSEFIHEGTRNKNAYISLTELDEKTFRRIIKYFRLALYKSRKKKLSRYVKKYHAIFVDEFERLIYVLMEDQRFLNDPADDN
ncbi:MAG: hypothetical protein U0457_10215 [Candidatus Sericytochromatia bacterium]